MNRPNKELKRIARENLNGRYGITMGAMVLANLIPTVILIPFSMLLNMNSVTEAIIYYLASFIISLLTIILSAGHSLLHLNIGRQKPYHLSDIFHCFKERPDCYILAFLLLVLRMLPCVIPAIAVFIAFIITQIFPFLILGIILYILGIVFMMVIALRYAQIFLLLVDNPYQKLRDVFAQSKQLMNGRKKQLFVLGLSFIGWYLLGVISLGIGFLWILPYMTQTSVCFYRDAIGEL